ncbi:TM2 domain-containing protein [Aeromicrobium sp.]|uniref:TM2 domain-containing protein n=1 Tax=Aeromicrobium sp. TaxID=1871063 RepID=UPI00199B65D9|nr:TM2 domain-containing protein [Aeromicrobium sp.]MBC7630400.1 TM2 domain-containing protein [Aeromicrobium sp.]
MTTTPPEPEDENEPTVSLEKDGGEPDHGRANPPPTYPPPGGYPPPPGYAPPPPPNYGQQQTGYPPPPGYAPPGYVYGAGPGAPYGVHPMTGVPYSDKQKLVAGLLQLLVPFGIGRMYMGDVGVGVAQLVVAIVTCGIGALWSFVDGIIILTGEPNDSQGRPLRP